MRRGSLGGGLGGRPAPPLPPEERICAANAHRVSAEKPRPAGRKHVPPIPPEERRYAANAHRVSVEKPRSARKRHLPSIPRRRAGVWRTPTVSVGRSRCPRGEGTCHPSRGGAQMCGERPPCQ